jgi:hypothetical protein
LLIPDEGALVLECCATQLLRRRCCLSLLRINGELVMLSEV